MDKRRLPYSTRKVTVQLSENVIEKLDRISESYHKKRPDIIREALNIYIKMTEKNNPQVFKDYVFKSIHDKND